MGLAKKLRDSGQRASGLYAGWLSPSDVPRAAQADTGYYAVGGSFYPVGTGPFPKFGVVEPSEPTPKGQGMLF